MAPTSTHAASRGGRALGRRGHGNEPPGVFRAPGPTCQRQCERSFGALDDRRRQMTSSREINEILNQRIDTDGE